MRHALQAPKGGHFGAASRRGLGTRGKRQLGSGDSSSCVRCCLHLTRLVVMLVFFVVLRGAPPASIAARRRPWLVRLVAAATVPVPVAAAAAAVGHCVAVGHRDAHVHNAKGRLEDEAPAAAAKGPASAAIGAGATTAAATPVPLVLLLHLGFHVWARPGSVGQGGGRWMVGRWGRARCRERQQGPARQAARGERGGAPPPPPTHMQRTLA